jgi:hypothetical protein
MLGFVAKAARHAAAGAVDQLGFGAWNHSNDIEHGADRAERLLMTMAVHQNAVVDLGELQGETAGLRLACDEFLEQRGARGNHLGGGAQVHHQCLIAQRQQAGRFQTHDCNAARGERQQRLDQFRHFAFGALEHACA